MSGQRLAFSAPDRDPAERAVLMIGFREKGYDGLQLKRMQYVDDVSEPGRFTERWGSTPGIASGLITGGRLDAAGVADLQAVIRFGAAVGSERVIFCHGEPRTEVDDDDIVAFSRTLAEIGRRARSLGVQLSLHHHYGQPVMYRSDFDRFFDGIDDGAVTLTVDTAHLVKSGITDIAEVIRCFGPRIDTIHIKDIAGAAFVPLGTGEIDFDPIFRALIDAAPTAWLCADEESGADIVGAMTDCHRYMTMKLDDQTRSGV